jgi:hypothetical protein
MKNLFLLISSVVREILPGIPSSDISSIEETAETKKCVYCLRRIKVFHHKCPHCRKTDFIFDTD